MSRLGWTPTMHQSYLWVIHPKRPKGFNLAFGRFGDLVSSYPLYMSFLYCFYMCKQIDIVPVLNHSTSCSRKMRSIPPCTLVKSCQSNFGHSDRAVQRQCPEKKGIFVMRFCCHRPVGECELFFRFFHIQLVSLRKRIRYFLIFFFFFFVSTLEDFWPPFHPVFRTNRSKLPKHRPFPPWSARAMVCCSWRHGGALSTVPRRSP